MKNEIGRKITSLTLMTIMFAGGMTLAIPGFLPDSAIPIEAFADQGTTKWNTLHLKHRSSRSTGHRNQVIR